MSSETDSPRPVIRVLPPELASQIAAGEVVERPASVVKELVENAIDSGARRVQVAIEAGGVKLIRVVDDGCGMTASAAELSLERHATSKLQTKEDLATISSLGFRGEALPSIASVSRLTIVSRPAEAVAGVRALVEGGAATEISETGCPVGTTLEVAELFYNVPARLKFLKTERTEAAHALGALLHLAMAWPEVHFTLTENGRTTLDLPRHRHLADRATVALKGRLRGQTLHPFSFELGELRVEAALGSAAAAVRTARNVYLLVNNRAVRDKLMLRMLASGYGELLERGRYPIAALHLTLPPEAVDVNVHPQKLEVRFAEEQAVARSLHAAVTEGVASAPWSGVSGVGVGAGGGVGGGRVYKLPRREGGAAAGGGSGGGGGRTGTGRLPLPPVGGGGRRDWGGEARPRNDYDHERVGLGDGSGAAREAAPIDAPEGSLRHCLYLGQIMDTYLLFEGEGELILLDQHAAHERVSYGRLRAGMAAGGVKSQRLLFPATVELDAAGEVVVAEQAELLATCGFEVELLSGRSAAVKAVPAVLLAAEPAGLLGDVCAELARGAPVSATVEEKLDHLAATLACHGSVRAGKHMTDVEVEALLVAMDEVEKSGHCPHGRPVVVRVSEGEIRKRFGRE